MKNEKQLVLFLRNNTKFDVSNLAQALTDKYEELGKAIIMLPDDKNPDISLITFKEGVINVNINYYSVSFIFYDEKDKYDLVFDIVETMENEELSFVRMGYISTYLHSTNDKDMFIKNFAVNPSLLKSDFNLAWYDLKLIDSVKVNFWERKLTDNVRDISLVSIFDINTPMDEEYNINTEFLKHFIKKCNNHIDDILDGELN